MFRTPVVLLALWLALGAVLCYAYAPGSYVWNGDPEALRRVAPPLRTLLAANLLLWLGAGSVGRWLLSRPVRPRLALGWVLLCGGWAVAARGAERALAAEHYALWKDQVTGEETHDQTFPAVTTRLLPVVLRDLQSPTESPALRSALALALKATPPAYVALQNVVEDPRQDPYLQFHCLKSLRELQPQRFAARLSAASDSARALYRRYEPDKP